VTVRFPSVINVSIRNSVTGANYILVRGDTIRPSFAHLAEIVGICNEPNVYGWLFEDKLQGKPYTRVKAVEWLTRSADGWRQGSHFIFVVTTAAGKVAAACEIMSNDANGAEIGYWSSEHHRGVMTNAVSEMCDLAQRAGFRALSARVRRGNARSTGVLRRVGFEPDAARSTGDGNVDWYCLSFSE